MHDPRKPIIRPGDDRKKEVREIAHSHLAAITEIGARQIGCTGASFVVLGVNIWIEEMCELEPVATAQMLRSLAILCDPKAKQNDKIRAEKKRQSAVNKLFAAVDLEMSSTLGNA